MPSRPQIHEPRDYPGLVLHVAGLALLAANKVRRTFRPYDRPRPWSAREIDRSVDYVMALYGNWRTGFGDAGVGDWLRGRRVLELGPGPDLGTGLILLAHGAHSYLADDRFPLLGSTPEAFYDVLLERLSGAPEVWRAVEAYQAFRRGDAGGALRYMILERIPGGAARPDGSPRDLWLSQAALEHVADPGPFLGMLSGWCAPGALALHHIDAATHTLWLRTADPLNVLRYGRGVYGALSFPGTPNRWRRGQYEECFRNIGWDVVDSQAVHRLSDRAIARARRGLAREFRDLSDDELGVHSFRLVLKKRPT